MSGFFNGLKNALSTFDSYSPAAQSKGRLDIAKQQEQIAEQQEEDRHRQADMEFHQHLTNIGAQPVVNGLVKRSLPGPDSNGGQMMGTLIDKADPARTVKFKDATGDQVQYELPTMAEQLTRQFQAQHDPQLISQQHQAEETETAHKAVLDSIDRMTRGVKPSDVFTPDQIKSLGINPDTNYKMLPQELSSFMGKTTPATIRANTLEDVTGQKIESNEKIATGNRQSRSDIAAANRTARQQLQDQMLSWKTQDETRNQQLKDQISQRSVAVQAGLQPNLGAAKLSAFQSHVNPLMQEADKQRAALSATPDLLDENKVKDGDTFTNPFTGGEMEMNPGVRQMLGDRAKIAMDRVDELHHAASHAAGVPELAAPAAPAAPKPTAQGGGKPDADHTYDSVPADIRSTVAAIVEGRRGKAGRGDGPAGYIRRVNQAVTDFDPDWSEQRAQIRKSFVLDKNIGANNTAVAHLDQLGDAAEALGNGSFTPGNAIYQKFKSIFGDAAPTNFEGIKNAVAGEMASALKGNATDPEIASMKANIDKSSSPEQLKGIIDENLKILAVKLNTYQERYSQQIPNDKKWSPILPTAKAVFAKHGINPTAAPAGTQPAGGGVQPIQLKDGRTLNPHSQADADRFRKDHPELIK